MSGVTTHILDTSKGRPASGVAVTLSRAGEVLGRGVTDADGRARGLLEPGQLAPGVYQISFATGDYFAAEGVKGFYPSVSISFNVEAGEAHYHVPLLLNPFGYSTYRGS